MTLIPKKSAACNLRQCLPNFKHINRYNDTMNGGITAKILPGQYYVTRSDEMITTVLGSCVAACIYDPTTGYGGMNHFLLPGGVDVQNQKSGLFAEESSARYGCFAMEGLINDILKCGSRRRDLRAKLFGGGRILQNMTDVGQKNIQFVKDYLRTENLPVESSDLGLIYPRIVNFFPATGKAMVKRLRSVQNDTIQKRELKYMRELLRQDISGDIELF